MQKVNGMLIPSIQVLVCHSSFKSEAKTTIFYAILEECFMRSIDNFASTTKNKFNLSNMAMEIKSLTWIKAIAFGSVPQFVNFRLGGSGIVSVMHTIYPKVLI